MADDVQLTDLLVIQRYSLAVRSTTAPREELLVALQADLDWLRDGQAVPPPAPVTSAPRRASVKARAPRAMAAKTPAATRPAAAQPTSAGPAAGKVPATRASTAVRAPGVRSPRP